MDWDIVAVVAAGLSVFLAVCAVLWPRKVTNRHQRDEYISGGSVMLPKVELGPDDTVPRVMPYQPTEAMNAVYHRGRHLRTD